ncbi:glycoside hydrolase family 28 protein [Schizophyllum commune H4-8]|uniref:galacturonan 1,4-alpha-galacturonidase n=1 Tax=Schizophyllum commune (strain H4-8 / FGSC 9210) TaxID=578458 RepID=D8Q7X1_SCHCM|nr:glycoside hydrolase family 28 protein [Schizophyllum commune H4-8]KAI5891305.1 glycoside hydrolase family 28 protein [Schizophyllum commune H4-8]
MLLLSLAFTTLWSLVLPVLGETCTLSPLGEGYDDTEQIESAVASCGQNGNIVFEEGVFNVTSATLAFEHIDQDDPQFTPDVDYWLNASNTYRVVFIQSQASWFVLTGSNFTVDAHGTGGILGNGQTWWSYFANRTREDGDGRPISFTLWQANNATIRDFTVDSPPFWCNTVAESENVLYDGMKCNATNQDPDWAGQNIVPNTDGINTFRADKVTLRNWDVTCGDDCLAIKGNSTNIFAENVMCRGGNGIAFGSLGQYANLTDNVENVVLDGITVYFKSWTGTKSGDPPTEGGGGTGNVTGVVARNVVLDQNDLPIHVYQTNGGHSGDDPSTLMFSNLTFQNWTGTATGRTLVNLDCSPAVGCANITFENFDVASQGDPEYLCANVDELEGLPASLPLNACNEDEVKRRLGGFLPPPLLTNGVIGRQSLLTTNQPASPPKQQPIHPIVSTMMAGFMYGHGWPANGGNPYHYPSPAAHPPYHARRHRRSLSLMHLPAELLNIILLNAHPMAILAVRKTCRTLYRVSKDVALWKDILRRLCFANDISFCSYPVDCMSLAQLEGAATAMSRILRVAEPAGGRYLFGATEDTVYLYDLCDLQRLRYRSTPRCVASYRLPGGKGRIQTVKTWPTPDNQGIEVMVENETYVPEDHVVIVVLAINPLSRNPSFRMVGRYEEDSSRFHSRVNDFIWISDDIPNEKAIVLWNFRNGRFTRWHLGRILDTVVASRDTVVSFSDDHLKSYADFLQLRRNPADDRGPIPGYQCMLRQTAGKISSDGVDRVWSYGYYGTGRQGPAFFSFATQDDLLYTHRVLDAGTATGSDRNHWPSKQLYRSDISGYWMKAPLKASEQDGLLAFFWEWKRSGSYRFELENKPENWDGACWFYVISRHLDEQGYSVAYNVGLHQCGRDFACMTKIISTSLLKTSSILLDGAPSP